jgi:cell division protein FtsI (penicillin-binding protein 3)
MKQSLLVFTALFLGLSLFAQQQNFNNELSTFSSKVLLNKIKEQSAEKGFVMIMETKTGKIVASSGIKFSKGKYIQDNSFINEPFNPGGLFLPISLSVLLDNTNISLNDSIDLEGGETTLGKQKIFDSELHGIRYANYKQVIETSSNVGVAKSIWDNYKKNTNLFLSQLNQITNYASVDTLNSTLPLNAIGYSIKYKPLEILAYYNAIANKGNKIDTNNLNRTEKLFKKESTLTAIQESLIAVCGKNGTASIFSEEPKENAVAGKTGTIKNLYSSNIKYAYTSAFAGYFPANNPEYTCLIVIKNKPYSESFYGGVVAAPVFKDIVKFVNNKNKH